jgi:hypothetical protein
MNEDRQEAADAGNVGNISVKMSAEREVRRHNDAKSAEGRHFHHLWQSANVRAWLLAFAHVMAFAAAYWFAYLLRFDFNVPTDAMEVFWASIVSVISLKLLIFYLFSQYHGWWRYVTFADLAALLRATFISLVVLVTVNFFMQLHISRGVLILDFITSIGILGSIRASWLMSRELLKPPIKSNRTIICRIAFGGCWRPMTPTWEPAWDRFPFSDVWKTFAKSPKSIAPRTFWLLREPCLATDSVRSCTHAKRAG